MSRNTHCNGRRGPRQRGFTLVELMIAMAVALFLLAGLGVLVQGFRNTYGTQSQLAQLQDSERLAMIMMTDVIQAAGYFPNPTINTLQSLPQVLPSFAQGQAIAGTFGGAAPGDSVAVRFMTAPNDTIINCTGSTNTTGATVVYTNTFSVNAQQQLVCALGINGAAPGAPVVLVNGVQNLQIWYGVKTNFATADNNVDTYLTAAQMTAADWSNVTSVKVRITFLNPLFGQPGQNAAAGYIERVVGVMARTGINI